MNKREALRLNDVALNILDLVHCLHTGAANEISFEVWQDMFARGKDYEAARKQWQRWKEDLEHYGLIERVEDGREDHVILKPQAAETAEALHAQAQAVLNEGNKVERRYPDTVTRAGRTFRLKVYGRRIPPLSDREYADLRASIAEHGILEHVLVDRRDNVVDGKAKLIIADELGLDVVPVKVLEIDDRETLEAIAYDVNVARRHLTKQQRAQLMRERQADAQAEAMRPERKSLRAIAEEHGVHESTIKRDTEAVPRDPRAKVRGKDGRLQPARKPTKAEAAKRRQDIAGLLAQGKSVAEIVEALNVSRRTVERIIGELHAEQVDEVPKPSPAPASRVMIVAGSVVGPSAWRTIDREAAPIGACLEAAIGCMDQLRERLQDPELAELAGAAHDIVESVLWRLMEERANLSA